MAVSGTQRYRFIVSRDALVTFDRSAENFLKNLSNNSGNCFSFVTMRKRLFNIYFDSPELLYLKKGGQVVYQAEEYFTKKKKKRKYHEHILYDSASRSPLRFDVKHYSKIQTGVGKHPLLSFVKRKQRSEFLLALRQDGVTYPLRMRTVFQVSRINHQIIIFDQKNESFIAYISSLLSSKRFHRSLSLGIVTIKIDRNILASFSKRQQAVIAEWLASLESIVTPIVSNDNDYKIIFDNMADRIPIFTFLLRYPSIFNFLYALITATIAFFVLYYFCKSGR